MRKTFQNASVVVMFIVGLLMAPAHAQAGGCGVPMQSSGLTAVVPYVTQSIGVSGPAGESDSAADTDRRNDSILGLWHVSYVQSDGTPSYQSFKFWHPDGTEWESANVSPLLGNVCMGVWKKTVAGTIRLHHVGWNFSNGNLVGTITLDEINTVATGGRTYTGTFTLAFYDLNGNSLSEVKGTLSAKRISVDVTGAP